MASRSLVILIQRLSQQSVARLPFVLLVPHLALLVRPTLILSFTFFH